MIAALAVAFMQIQPLTLAVAESRNGSRFPGMWVGVSVAYGTSL